MYHWLKVKKSRDKPNMDEIIKDLVRKRNEQKMMTDQSYKDEKKRQKKEKREKERLDELDQ